MSTETNLASLNPNSLAHRLGLTESEKFAHNKEKELNDESQALEKLKNMFEEAKLEVNFISESLKIFHGFWKHVRVIVSLLCLACLSCSHPNNFFSFL